MPEDPYLNRMDGYFVCDELAVLVHRLRELICHRRIADRYSYHPPTTFAVISWKPWSEGGTRSQISRRG
jgi:hypothetical protein